MAYRNNYSRGEYRSGPYRSNYSEQRQGGGGYGGQRSERREDKKGKFFVGGLPPDATKEQLMDCFEEFGTIEDAVVIKDFDTGNSRGFGFVTMYDEDAKDAVLSSRKVFMINEKEISAKACHNRDRGGGQQRQQYRPRNDRYNDGY